MNDRMNGASHSLTQINQIDILFLKPTNKVIGPDNVNSKGSMTHRPTYHLHNLIPRQSLSMAMVITMSRTHILFNSPTTKGGGGLPSFC